MNELKFESVWFDQHKFEEAECLMYKDSKTCADDQSSSIVSQISKARETIQQTLKGEAKGSATTSPVKNVDKRLETLEAENKALKDAISNIQENLKKLEQRVNCIDVAKGSSHIESSAVTTTKNEEKSKEESEDDDSDSDLFGSDDDDEEAAKAAEERKKAFAEAKKAKKPAVVAKSNIVLDVKPWDDETDMVEVEKKVRSIQQDGLLWGASKLVPVGYGIKKLQITCVVEDDKVGTEDLEEKITQFEDHVQSVDIAAFNKV